MKGTYNMTDIKIPLLTTAVAYANNATPFQEGQRWLTTQQTARWLGISRASVWNWLKTKENFPKPVYFTPKKPKWRVSEIESFEAAIIAANQ